MRFEDAGKRAERYISLVSQYMGNDFMKTILPYSGYDCSDLNAFLNSSTGFFTEMEREVKAWYEVMGEWTDIPSEAEWADEMSEEDLKYASDYLLKKKSDGN